MAQMWKSSCRVHQISLKKKCTSRCSALTMNCLRSERNKTIIKSALEWQMPGTRNLTNKLSPLFHHSRVSKVRSDFFSRKQLQWNQPWIWLFKTVVQFVWIPSDRSVESVLVDWRKIAAKWRLGDAPELMLQVVALTIVGSTLLHCYDAINTTFTT